MEVVVSEILSVVGVWIFSGTTHAIDKKIYYFLGLLQNEWLKCPNLECQLMYSYKKLSTPPPHSRWCGSESFKK